MMLSYNWTLTLFVLESLLRFISGKSCTYNNLHATFDWSRVRSPKYPSRFAPQTQCSWKITAPPLYRVQLELTDFSLVPPDDDNKCVSQWLNIISWTNDEDAEGAQLPMLTLCGTNRPRMIVTAGNAVKLNLHSDSAASTHPYRGFSARYKFTKDEEPFMPDISNKLPESASTNNGRIPSRTQITMNGASVGDIVNPHVKPRPLPPNPNAVLTLQNRRTESRNRVRNDGVSSANSANNGDSFSGNRRRLPPSNGRPDTRLPSILGDGNIIKQEDLPPPRGKRLPQEAVILLAVLGTVGAVVLILYLLKKFVYDKKIYDKSGKKIHAYANFRRFKKKGRNEEEDEEKVSKINTITASVTSANCTLNSRDSGLATLNETNRLEKGDDKANVRPMQSTRIKQSSNKSSQDITQGKTHLQQDIINMPRPEVEGSSTSDTASEKEHLPSRRQRYRRRNEYQDRHTGRRHRRRRRETDKYKDRTRTDWRGNVESSDNLDHQSRGSRSRGNGSSGAATHGRGRRSSPTHRDSDNARRSTWRERAYS